MEATLNGRTYQVTAMDMGSMPKLAAHLAANGCDGVVYLGVSEPTGRQRKVFHATLYRRNGQFFSAL